MGTSQLSAQAAIIGVGRLMNILAAAGTLVVLARVMPETAEMTAREGYGVIRQLILLYMVLSQIFAVGLPQSTYYFLPRYTGGERRGFLVQTLILLALSGVVMAAGLFLGAELIGRLMNSARLPGLLRIFALYPIFMLPTLALEGTLLNQNRAGMAMLFGTLSRVGMFCALVVPTLLHATLEQTVSVWTAVAAVTCVMAVAMMLATVRGLPFAWHPRMLRDEWAFSLPLAAGLLVAVSGSYLDQFLVSHYFGTAVFGAYSNAMLEIPTVTVVSNATAVVLMAEFSRRTSAGEHRMVMPIWHQAMMKSGVLGFASLGFLAFWAPETMRLLFSERFADSGMLFSIAVWVIPPVMLILEPLYVSLGATRVMVVYAVIALAVKIVCVLGGGWLYGLSGIAIGAVATRYILAALGVHWYARWMTKIGWRLFLPWRVLGTSLLAALLAGGLSWLVHLLPCAHWPLAGVYALALVLFLALYVAGLAMTGLLGYAIPRRFLPMRLRGDREVMA